MRSSGWVGLGLALSLAVYLLLALPLFDVPLRGDETIWTPAAAAISEHGVPEQRFDEMALVTHPDSFIRDYEADWGVGHPPAYLYLLALPTATLDDATAGRLVSVLCALATLSLIFFAARAAARRVGLGKNAAAAASAAVALAVGASPYWVAYSLYLDIDTSLYTLAQALAVWLAVRYERLRRLLPLTLVLAALHWVKLTAFAFTAAGLLGHWAISRRLVLAGRAALAAVLASALFAGTWIAYSELTGVPASWLHEYLQADKGGTQQIRSLFEVLNTLRGFVAGIGFPLAVLILVGGVRYTLRVVRGAVEEHDAFFVVGMLTVLTYTLLFPYAGKYVVPALPLLALHGTVEAFRIAAERRLPVDARRVALAAAVAVAVFAFQLFGVGDMITGPEFRDAATRDFGGALDDPRLVLYALALVPLALIAAAARLFLRLDVPVAIALAALVAVVPANIGETIATQPRQETSVIPVRETGFDVVLDWLENAPRGTRVLAEADVAFHLPKLRVVPQDRNYYYPATELTEALADPGLRYVVVAKGREPADAGFADVLAARFAMVKRAGTFSIYEQR